MGHAQYTGNGLLRARVLQVMDGYLCYGHAKKIQGSFPLWSGRSAAAHERIFFKLSLGFKAIPPCIIVLFFFLLEL